MKPLGYTVGTLLQGMASAPVKADCTVSGICMDSRLARPGDLFLACRGERTHGATYVGDALRAGATAVALEEPCVLPCELPPNVALARVPALRRQAGVVADRFFAAPSKDLRVFGVTGTNGKTTVTQLTAQALTTLHGGVPHTCGLIGTLGYGFADALLPTGHTTPDAVSLHRLLRKMYRQGARFAALEVSSHALEQDRVRGVRFDVAVLTGLGQDHLDYHGTPERYAAAKRRLFDWPGLRCAVLNLDDALGLELSAQLQGKLQVIGYVLEEGRREGGLESVAGRKQQAVPEQVRARILSLDRTGMELELCSPWGSGCLRTALLGVGNARNLAAATAVLGLWGHLFTDILRALAIVAPLPGRMERFAASGRPLVVVDYAHTPDALELALHDLRSLQPGRLYCVFGCGGERDRSKRAHMGAVAERLSDQVVLTSDNPRREDPERILKDILAGVSEPARVRVEAEREQAIGWTLRQATVADIVLIAGKGHEDFQEIDDQRRPLSDRTWVRHWMEQ